MVKLMSNQWCIVDISLKSLEEIRDHFRKIWEGDLSNGFILISFTSFNLNLLNVPSKMVIGWAESCLCEVTASTTASTHNRNQAVCPVSQHFSQRLTTITSVSGGRILQKPLFTSSHDFIRGRKNRDSSFVVPNLYDFQFLWNSKQDIWRNQCFCPLNSYQRQ